MSEIILRKTSILKILADPSRYKILELLINSNGKLCVGDIAEQSSNSPSAVSHQLAKLESAGLIKPLRNGQQTVSYTHLDVYKRQIQWRDFTINSLICGQNPIRICNLIEATYDRCKRFI